MKANPDLAIPDGTENRDAGRSEAFEDVRMGHAIAISPPGGTHRQARMNGLQEYGCRGRMTPVMGQLEDIGLKTGAIGSDQALLGWSLDVPGQ